MTQEDKFMKNCIKRRFSLTTLLEIARLMRGLRKEEIEKRFLDLNRVLEHCRSEQEFCWQIPDFTKVAQGGTEKSMAISRIL